MAKKGKRQSKEEREQQEQEQFLGTYEGYEISKLQEEMAEIIATLNKLDVDKSIFLSTFRSKSKHLKKRLAKMSDLLEDKKTEEKKAEK